MKMKMKNIKNNLVIREEDYSLLISYLNNARRQPTFDRRNAYELASELEKATLVNKIDFPGDVIGLNSRVRIKAEDKSEEMEFVIVKPERANITEKKISIMAPIGTTLIGFRQGQKVKWKMPAGNKTFTILEVNNDFEKNNA
jgi:regulator of nucleoside diphosphate kinase